MWYNINYWDMCGNLSGVDYDIGLFNRYTNGKDSVNFHADDEKTIDQNESIASVSFGDTRDFVARVTKDHSITKKWKLAHRDLLIMKPGMQKIAQHSIPKRAHAGVRVNATFRKVHG